MAPCVYCGKEPGTTDDHVPPKSIFPEPRPSDLVTVPCCEDCRKDQSKDDEYFKNMIVLRHDVAADPLVKTVVDSVHRALARPEGQAFTTSLLRSARTVEKRTLAGLIVGLGTTYSVDIRRLDKVIHRTLRGLYFREFGERLPDTHGAVVYTVSAFQGLSIQKQAQLQRLLDIALTGTIRDIGSGVFTYAVHTIPDVPHCTLWLFTVYQRVAFIGFTCKSEDLPSRT